MPIVQISLTFSDLNASVQVGDSVFYSQNMHSYGGQETVPVSSTTRLGEIVNIIGITIKVNYDDKFIYPSHPN